MFEGKIVEILTKTRISNSKEVLIGVLFDRVGNVDNDANDANTYKVDTIRACKGEVGI